MTVSDDTILGKLRRALPGNTPRGELRGSWFTGAECVRLLEMLGEYERKRQGQPGKGARQ